MSDLIAGSMLRASLWAVTRLHGTDVEHRVPAPFGAATSGVSSLPGLADPPGSDANTGDVMAIAMSAHEAAPNIALPLLLPSMGDMLGREPVILVGGYQLGAPSPMVGRWRSTVSPSPASVR